MYTLKSKTLFKVLNEDGTTPQGYGQWDLSGEWMPEIEGKLIPCQKTVII